MKKDRKKYKSGTAPARSTGLYFGAVFFTICAPAQSYYPAGLGKGNLQLWLTAADAATVLNPGGTAAANGDFIATWKDKSGNGADATQTTSGIQPVYWTNQLNGSGAIIFTTEGQYPVAVPGGASLTVSRLPAGSYFVRIRAEGSPSCCRS